MTQMRGEDRSRICKCRLIAGKVGRVLGVEGAGRQGNANMEHGVTYTVKTLKFKVYCVKIREIQFLGEKTEFCLTLVKETMFLSKI